MASAGGSNDPPPIAEAQEIANKTNANNKIIYEIRVSGRGNPVIEDTRGFTYSFQKSSKGKSKIPKYTYWHCIKVQNKAIRKKNKSKKLQMLFKNRKIRKRGKKYDSNENGRR